MSTKAQAKAKDAIRLSNAAYSAFVALQAGEIEIIFGCDDDVPVSAYWSTRNFHESTIRSLWRRGYIRKIQNVTKPEIARNLIAVWRCGLSDAGRRAWEEAQ